jgi:hypothetical protein
VLEEIAKRNSQANLKQNNNTSYLSSVRNQTVGKGNGIGNNIGRVDQELGIRAGLGKDTIRGVDTLLQKASQELLDKARKGHYTINEAFKHLQNEQKRQDLINARPIIELPDNIKLIQGDLREKGKEISDNSIDLILTDPPYSKEYLYLYEDLGLLAARVLKEGGSLITLTGHQAVLRAGNYVQESGLKFMHIISLVHSGASAMIYACKIRVKWKPMLWFTKGTKPNMTHIIEDVILSTPPGKALHKWEQSPIEAEHIIKGLTVGENQVVLDPFMGVGTFGKAAQAKQKVHRDRNKP